MKYSAIALAALATTASAQDLSIFPPCSLTCITDAVGTATNCGATDYVCVCANIDALTGAATACVIDACGAEVATGQVLPATQQFCAQVEAGGSSSNGSTSSGSPTTPPPSSTSTTNGTGTETEANNSTITTAPTTPVPPFNNATTTTARTTPGQTTTAAPTQITGAAAHLGALGSVALLVIGAAAAAL